MDALCQVCYIEPSIGLHEASQLRCCVGCLVLAVRRGGRREPAVETI